RGRGNRPLDRPPTAPRSRVADRRRSAVKHRDGVADLLTELLVVRAQAGDLLDQRLDAVDQALPGPHHRRFTLDVGRGPSPAPSQDRLPTVASRRPALVLLRGSRHCTYLIPSDAHRRVVWPRHPARLSRSRRSYSARAFRWDCTAPSPGPAGGGAL